MARTPMKKRTRKLLSVIAGFTAGLAVANGASSNQTVQLSAAGTTPHATATPTATATPQPSTAPQSPPATTGGGQTGTTQSPPTTTGGTQSPPATTGGAQTGGA